MIRTKIVIAAAFIMCSALSLSAQMLRAKAELRNAQGEPAGVVLFDESSNDEVTIKVTVTHLPTGYHALHIHDQAKCDPPGFTSAGEHFNPAGKEHGFMNSKGPHAGDLPNIEVKNDGTAEMQIYSKLISLKKDVHNSLFKSGGASVVIHQNPDDYVTNPSGGGGNRIACGPIEMIK